MLKVLADTDKSAPLRHLEQVATQPRPFKTAVLWSHSMLTWSNPCPIGRPNVMYGCTGVHLTGANLSGDLKDPAKALPKGTLLAKCTSFSTYMIFATLLAACFDRDALQVRCTTPLTTN